MGGDKDRAEGTWDEAKGNEGGRGGATDNEDLEAEGKKDQTKGAGKKAWGATKDAADEVKDAAGKAKDAVKEKVDDD